MDGGCTVHFPARQMCSFTVFAKVQVRWCKWKFWLKPSHQYGIWAVRRLILKYEESRLHFHSPFPQTCFSLLFIACSLLFKVGAGSDDLLIISSCKVFDSIMSHDNHSYRQKYLICFIFKMRIAKMIPKVGYNRFYLLLARSSVSPSGGKLGAENKCIFFRLYLRWH